MPPVVPSPEITRETIESRTRTVTFDAAPLRLDDSDRLVPVLNGWLDVVLSRCQLEVALDALQRSRTDPVFDVAQDPPPGDHGWCMWWLHKIARTAARAIALPLPRDPETLPLDGTLAPHRWEGRITRQAFAEIMEMQRREIAARLRDRAGWVREAAGLNDVALTDPRFAGRRSGLTALNRAVELYVEGRRRRRATIYELTSDAYCEFAIWHAGRRSARFEFMRRFMRRVRAVLPFVLPDVNMVIGGNVVTTGPTTLDW